MALAQDLLLIEMYKKFSNTVIHGEIAIWRCYGSNRFSEDIDVYMRFKDKNKEKLKGFFDCLKPQGLFLKKFKLTKNTLFSKISYGDTDIRVEAIFKKIKQPFIKPYELLDETFINVLTLTPEELILERMLAYKKRKKIRDIYDIYFLLKFVTDKKKIKDDLKYTFGIMDFLKKTPVVTTRDIKLYLKQKNYSYLLLSNLVKQRKIKRITKSFYTIHEDPIVSVFCFRPAYLGLQEALSLYNLWEQETNVVIITTKKVRIGIHKLLESNVLVHRIKPKYFLVLLFLDMGSFLFRFQI
jgi:predicted nucleotidyltransferase component of viral defense system